MPTFDTILNLWNGTMMVHLTLASIFIIIIMHASKNKISLLIDCSTVAKLNQLCTLDTTTKLTRKVKLYGTIQRQARFISLYRLLFIFIVVISLQENWRAPSACLASPTISDNLEILHNNNRQQLINHNQHKASNFVLSAGGILTPASLGNTAKENSADATIDDQDQTTYQKVAVGRSVTFKCGVKNIGKHKLSWIHKDRHTFLAFSDKVVLNNGRIKVSSQADTVFYLHIDNVQLTDKGQIMCQLNTNPMRSQIHTLDIVESPRIIDHLTSSNVEPTKEGRNVSLRCGASGLPQPDISWRREMDRTRLAHLPIINNSSGGTNGTDVLISSSTSPYLFEGSGQLTTGKTKSQPHSDAHIVARNNHHLSDTANAASNQEVTDKMGSIDETNNIIDDSNTNSNVNKIITVQGQYLNITRVDRRDMGYYVCIASNGVPTSVSRRIFLPVSFGPALTPSKHQRVKPSARDVVLYCDLESYPKSITHWTFNGQALFEPQLLTPKKTISATKINHQVRLRNARSSKIISSSTGSIVRLQRSASSSSSQQLILNDNESDNKYEMSTIDDVDNYNYKSILMLKIKDFQQTDYGVYICAAKNNFGEAQAKINVLPKDYTRLVPIVTTVASVPQNMILSQHRLHHNNHHNNGNNSNNSTMTTDGRVAQPTNVFTVNGVKYIQIGSASSVSLATPDTYATASAINSNRIISNNNGHDLRTNINRYNPSLANINNTTTNSNKQIGNNRIVNSKSVSIMNGDNTENNIQVESTDNTNDKQNTPSDDGADNNDDNHLDLRLDLTDNNNGLDLEIIHQGSSSSSSSSARLAYFRWLEIFAGSSSWTATSHEYRWTQVLLFVMNSMQLFGPSLISIFIWLSIYA